MYSELDILIGGQQGAGLETSMQLLSMTFARLGYGIVSDREYFSNIKGRHSYITLRASSISFPRALKETAYIVGAMDPETVFTHYNEVEEGGCLIYDVSSSSRSIDSIPSIIPQLRKRINNDFQRVGVDGTLSSLIEFIKDEGKIKVIELHYPQVLDSLSQRFKLAPEQASRYVSSILFGAITGLVDFDEGNVRTSIETRFLGRETIIEQNVHLVKHVSNLVKKEHGSPFKLQPSTLGHRELIVASGNDLVAIGKMVSGLRYQSYYPITPAADESFLIESYDRLYDEERLGGIVVLQTEDEIAAVTSAIGATLTGARSATATSGPGFSLMVEGLGWAGMNEAPVVITYYQRSGPSTGQATRGSQADLLPTMFSGHGEFAKFILASGDHEEAFNDSIEAFNLAERYQVPIIHLLDKFVANSLVTLPIPDLTKVKIDRGDFIQNPRKDYKRFDLSKTISPRAPLGSNAVIGYSGSEHDERGRTTEDPVNRMLMYEKRIKKLEIADAEIPGERRAVYFGPERADFLLVGWGYTKMVALDTLKELEKTGHRGAYLHLKMFIPFPSQYVKSILDGFTTDKVVSLEYNYLAQASRAIRMFTSFDIKRSIVKYTGRPMYLKEVVGAVKQILEKDAKKVVLSYGS